MANRFLDTNFYKSPFVKSLSGELKSLYSFIICDCTPAGIWCIDLDAAKLYTGFSITKNQFDLNFIKTGKAIKIATGKFFFPDFIEHQYPGGLSDNNKAHKNILLELRKFNLLTENNLPKKEAPLESPLIEPLKGVQGQGNGNGQGNKDERPSFWFLKFYHMNYADYKSHFNGKSAKEEVFLEWKQFVDFIYEKKFEEIFSTKFISPHDYQTVITENNFIRENWEEVLKRILATGVKPEHNLLYRIPQFIEINNSKNERHKQSTGTKTSVGNRAAAGRDQLLGEAKNLYSQSIRNKGSGG